MQIAKTAVSVCAPDEGLGVNRGIALWIGHRLLINQGFLDPFLLQKVALEQVRSNKSQSRGQSRIQITKRPTHQSRDLTRGRH